MNCEVCERHVDGYVDGELGAEARLAFDAHLSQCGPCRERVAFQRSFKEQLQQSVQDVQAPLGLHQHIHVALMTEAKGSEPNRPIEALLAFDETSERVQRVQRPAARLGGLLRFGARSGLALAVAAGVGLFALGVSTAPGTNSPGLAEPVGAPSRNLSVAAPVETVTAAPGARRVQGPARTPDDLVFQDVVRLHNHALPADVEGERPDAVAGFFRGKVAFPVRPARFRGQQVKLVGARLSNVRERQAAVLFYDVGGRRLTVVVFESPEGLDRGAIRVRRGGREVFYRWVHGRPVPMREHGGLHYAFTGDFDQEVLLSLAAGADVAGP